MILGRENTVPIEEIGIHDPQRELSINKLTLVRQDDHTVELSYRWLDSGAEKVLLIQIRSSTLAMDDLNAKLTSWAQEPQGGITT